MSRSAFFILALALALTACAAPPTPAVLGQSADIATTAGAIAAGATEANPIAAAAIGSPVGAVALIGAKLGLPHYARSLPWRECVSLSQSAYALGFGAAANNVALFGAGPFAPLVGLGAGALAWDWYDDHAYGSRDCGMPSWDDLFPNGFPTDAEIAAAVARQNAARIASRTPEFAP